MLLTPCIHPEILSLLAQCGHGDKILIADGNFPMETKTPQAKHIYLGLCAGIPTATSVLSVLQNTISIEQAEVMSPDDGSNIEIFSLFSEQLNAKPLIHLERNDFYSACQNQKVKLVIGTGEKRLYGNILLTIGVA